MDTKVNKIERDRARWRKNSARWREENNVVSLHVLMDAKQSRQLDQIAKYLGCNRSEAVRRTLDEMHKHVMRHAQSAAPAK